MLAFVFLAGLVILAYKRIRLASSPEEAKEELLFQLEITRESLRKKILNLEELSIKNQQLEDQLNSVTDNFKEIKN